MSKSQPNIPFVTKKVIIPNNNENINNNHIFQHSKNNSTIPSSIGSSSLFGWNETDVEKSKGRQHNNLVGSILSNIIFPNIPIVCKSLVGITITLYILNQKHYLPKSLSSIVSKVLFWPTLPITIGRRYSIGSSSNSIEGKDKWISIIDDTIIMGGAPFTFLNNLPELLYTKYNVRGVINMCEEYTGPIQKYQQHNIQSLHLPTTDHFEPSISNMNTAIDFIKQFNNTYIDTNNKIDDDMKLDSSNDNNDVQVQNTNKQQQQKQQRVYIHCRAGHGRSAAIVMAWMIYKNPTIDIKILNEQLLQLRNVRRTLWKQPNLQQYQQHLQLQQQQQNNKNKQQQQEEVEVDVANQQCDENQ